MSKKEGEITPDLLDKDIEGFSSFDLDSRLLRAVAKLGYSHPTLVQAKAVPLALQGKDILARARTGSGKTAAYCLPIVQKILLAKENASTPPSTRALILVPTRELAEQVHRHITELTLYCSKEVTSVNLATADANVASHRAILAEFPDIVVSTPSKVLAHLEAQSLVLKESLESLVIDEADLILSYGYDDDLRNILAYLPKIYQSYLMSATLTPDVDKLKQLVLRNPAILKLTESDTPSDSELVQYFIRTPEHDKFLLTYFILKLRIHPFGTGKCIIFVNDIDRCYKLKLFLEQFGVKCCTLNSELPLKSRYHIVQEFNRGIYDYIIATDEGGDLRGIEVESDNEEEEAEEGEGTAEADGAKAGEDEEGESSTTTSKKRKQSDSESKSKTKKRRKTKDSEYGVSRGVDFQNVQAVINFDLPKSSRSYMHRVGRTARGVGNKGWALSFIMPEDDKEVVEPRRKKKGKDVEVVVKKQIITDEDVFKRVEKKQAALGRSLSPYQFDMSQVEGFRYRTEDALRAVTRTAIKEARLKELKQEILNSEKLKAHFEDNPTDLQALRHDKPLHPARVQPHLKHIPDYLMPKRTSAAGASVGHVPFRMQKRRRPGGKKGNFGKKGGKASSSVQKRKADPLKSFSYSG
ncbi:ATP-dependent DNA/RNA helicase [Rhizophlyctis rosea]|nr:ATP-dependent DNA/RNA helicase [Rhizophlyctis rosea]